MFSFKRDPVPGGRPPRKRGNEKEGVPFGSILDSFFFPLGVDGRRETWFFSRRSGFMG